MAVESDPISLLLEYSHRDSFETFREEMEQSMLFPQKRRNRIYALERAIKNDVADGLFIELGVAGGAGCQLFGKFLAPLGKGIHGFDSFEGLEEEWTGIDSGRGEGAFSQGGVLPKVPANVTLVKGWVQDTLPPYLKETGKAPFSFIHMDMDTYTPTLFALKAVKPRLRKGSVILFDELYGYPGWRHHEYKALQEVLAPSSYRFISFSKQSVAIEMLKKP